MIVRFYEARSMTKTGKERSKLPPAAYDVQIIRADFPIFRKTIGGKPLIYLDNAATTQKPQTVIEALTIYYTRTCSSVHRGIYYLSECSTELYEASRSKVQHFINAASIHEIVFVRGATEGINLVAQTYGRINVEPGDEILITAMEHHSNLVPWQMLCEEKGARLRVVPINPAGEFCLEQYKQMLSPKTRLVAVTHVSNVLGTINPLDEIIDLAHARDILVLVDGAQAVPHMPVDVQALDCDFYVFSGHKAYGPTGIGILYGKERFLDAMPPYQSGGEMISSVTYAKSTFNELPHKFEAGTPHIAGAIGLGASIDYLQSVGLENISIHERELTGYVTLQLLTLDDLRIIGTAKEKTGILSFILKDIHPHDIGTILDQQGIAVRTGHHCAQPLMDFFKIPATARISFGLYNTREEIDALILSLKKVIEVFR
jgi:cysteine desulfurase/selenocysteine lyase